MWLTRYHLEPRHRSQCLAQRPGSHWAEVRGVFVGFVLPRGYPDSVTPDYLNYQLRCLPAHITGWMSKSLATSSLIHALGVGPVSPSGTVAASAAIKWITKDGIGAFGRFLVRPNVSKPLCHKACKFRPFFKAHDLDTSLQHVKCSIPPSGSMKRTGILAFSYGQG